MKARVNPKSPSNQSSKPCTVLQYPSKKNGYSVFRFCFAHNQRAPCRPSHRKFLEKRPTYIKRALQKRPSHRPETRPCETGKDLFRNQLATIFDISLYIQKSNVHYTFDFHFWQMYSDIFQMYTIHLTFEKFNLRCLGTQPWGVHFSQKYTYV